MAETGTLRLFPLNTVLFPGAVVNLHVFEERYRTMIAECLDTGEAFGVVLIREGQEAGDPDVDPHEIGTTAEIAEVTPLPAGRYAIRAVGERRFRIERIVSRDPYLLAEVAFVEDEPDDPARAAELIARVAADFREYVRLLVAFSGKTAEVRLPADPARASYAVGDALQVADALKQHLLEMPSSAARLAAESGLLRRLLPQLRQVLERRHSEQRVVREEAPGGEFRSRQERYFGKHFSMN
ncbi:MAG TPA: LON peptidase substrate-binding domain-containing protein [Candidatus Baltobacteraceae bacterium]|nr:LON peptidase substrate-binding domain-containing protein [Candidatus Baltobacteraceae bacterium]